MEPATFRLANLLADSTRAEMVSVLMDGRSFPAGELAALCHVSAATASHHLRVLTESGVVTVLDQGRHRYFRIADDATAQLIESLGQVARIAPKPTGELVKARKCYSHLAGAAGVSLQIFLESQGAVRDVGEMYQWSADVSPGTLFGGRELQPAEQFGKQCLDWTERRFHIGGSLGRYLLNECLRLGYVVSTEMPRQLRITQLGESLGLFGACAAASETDSDG